MSLEKIQQIVKDWTFADRFLQQYENDFQFKKLLETMETTGFDFKNLAIFQTELDKYFQSVSLCQDPAQECQQENKGLRFGLIFENGHLFLILQECYHQNDVNLFSKNCLFTEFPQQYLTTDLKSQVKNIANKERNLLLKHYENLLKDYENTKKWLILTGNFGVGKTFLSVFFAQRFAFKKKGKVIFINANTLFAKFNRRRFFDTDLDFFIEQLKKVDLLILDDFGNENRLVQFRDEFLLPILQARFHFGLLTFIVSNFSYADLKKSYLLGGDKAEKIRHTTFFNLFDTQAKFLTLTTIFKE